MPSYQSTPAVILTVVAILITQPLSAGPEPGPSPQHAAQMILREAKAHASRIKDMDDRASILQEIALQQADIGDVDGALQTANAIDERIRDKSKPSIGINWPAEMKWQVLDEIVKDLAKSWDNDALIRLATTGVIKQDGFDGFVLYEAVIALTDLGEIKRALQLSTKIIEYPTNFDSLRYIAIGQRKRGDTQGSVRTISLMSHVVDQSSTLTELVAIDVAAGKLDRARATIAKIAKKGDQATARALLARATWSKGEKRIARRLLQRAVVDVQREKQIYREEALLEIVKTRSVFGNPRFDDVLAAATPIKDLFHKVSVFSAVGLAQAKLGDVCGSSRTFQAALELAKTDTTDSKKLSWGPNLKVISLERLAIDRARAGDTEGVMDTLHVLGEDHDWTLHDVVKTLAKEHRWSVALRVAKSMQEEDEKNAAIRNIALTQLQNGKIGVAVQTLKMAPDGPANVYFLLRLVHARAKQGDLQQARATIHQAIRYARMQGGEDRYSVDWQDILETQLKYEGPSATEKTLTAVLPTAKLIELPLIKMRFLIVMAVFQAKIGQHSASAETFRTALKAVEESDHRSRAFEEIATARASVGQLEAVQKWAVVLKSPEERASVLLGAAWGLTHNK